MTETQSDRKALLNELTLDREAPRETSRFRTLKWIVSAVDRFDLGCFIGSGRGVVSRDPRCTPADHNRIKRRIITEVLNVLDTRPYF